MKAAILREVGQPLTIEDVDLDGPWADEIRLRVVASGLCHSDYHIIKGDLPTTLPAILGHEAAGVVEAVGQDVRGLQPGDLVVTCFSSYCGACGECQSGHNHRCDNRPARPGGLAGSRITQKGLPIYQLGNLGGFAEEMVVHHRSVAKLPEGMPLDAAALLGCAVLTGAGAVLNGAKVEPGSSVAVLGCGGVGLNVIQAARIAGATRVIAIDLNPSKLELAKVFGATDMIAGGGDAVGEVVELSGGGVDYAFEVIGSPATMRDAFLMLRKGGAAVLLGIAKSGAELSIPIAPFVFKEVRILSSLMGSSPFQLFVPQLAQYYLNGSLKLDELVSRRIALEEINEGYASMAAGDVARSVVVF
jgi:S-(hydroxymethyl)glutathione dehydrogenase/alcohol dehydrogenase